MALRCLQLFGSPRRVFLAVLMCSANAAPLLYNAVDCYDCGGVGPE